MTDKQGAWIAMCGGGSLSDIRYALGTFAQCRGTSTTAAAAKLHPPASLYVMYFLSDMAAAATQASASSLRCPCRCSDCEGRVKH